MAAASALTASTAPLTLSQILAYTPSVLATDKHHDRKDTYKYISTAEMIEAMGDKGFRPFAVHQITPRKNAEDRRGFARHAITFRHESMFGTDEELIPQVVILNSHDGTTAFRMMAGFFRFVCSNGLIAGDGEGFAINHSGKATMANVIEASFEVLNQCQNKLAHVQDWMGITLNDTQRLELATQAHAIKFGNKASDYFDVITPEMFLEPRNEEDYGNRSLWSTYNVLQENIMKGGLVGMKQGTPAFRNNRHERMKVSTRPINNVIQNIDLNRKLWNMAEEYASNIITL